jgi:aminopeptidase N
LIYLSSLSYLPELLRPAAVRGAMLDYFYSDMLLAHEIAHQWWGNLVLPSDYRSGWIVEALANYAAWELFEKERGVQPARKMLEYYSEELRQPGKDGVNREEKGPIDLGIRLKTTDPEAWRVVTYDKGTWIIRMLHHRLGDSPFQQFERALTKEFTGRALSNESLRTTAARFLAKGDPDPSLDAFFDAWVYGTGVPRLALKPDEAGAGQYQLAMSGVGRDFAVDVPLQVQGPGVPPTVKWVRAGLEPVTFTAPRGAVVSLPAPSDFLYAVE